MAKNRRCGTSGKNPTDPNMILNVCLRYRSLISISSLMNPKREKMRWRNSGFHSNRGASFRLVPAARLIEKLVLRARSIHQLAVGHGISRSLLDEVRQIAKEFFGLPMEEKQKYSKVLDGDKKYGYEGYGIDRIVSEDQILDWTANLYLLLEPQDMRKLRFWPENPSTFRGTLHEYNLKTSLVVKLILRAMAMVLGLEENYFVGQFDERSTTYARFGYFPRCSRPDLVLGLRPHSDMHVITINLQDDSVEGLQVLKDGEWFKVPVVPHALLVNIGDQMEIMSNGIFKSPEHRVVTNSERERLSVVLCYSPKPDMEIQPADGLVNETRPRLYKKMKVKDYVNIYLEGYTHAKRSIDLAKV